jgi:hypothetical protein
MKRIPLEGKKFGKLTVIEYIGSDQYRCRCDCGKLCEVNGHNLKRGHTASCGCLRGFVDLTGNRFGKLTVIERSPNKKRGDINRTQWHCQCDCGNVVDVYSDSLISGDTASCGCLSHEKGIPDVWRDDFVDGTQITKIQSIPTKSNKSGVVGVNWDKSRYKWQASLRFKGKKYNLGRFAKFDDAVAARKAAEKIYFGSYRDGVQKNEKNDD